MAAWNRPGANAVHPRACGEHTMIRISAKRDGGSSPRMRGTLDEVEDVIVDPRFIPAHAGNT